MNGKQRTIDTKATWRIGDGTAFIIIFITQSQDLQNTSTFRSSKIREGQLTLWEEALKLVEEENRPRYRNIRWYLDTLNLDFERVIKIVNIVFQKCMSIKLHFVIVSYTFPPSKRYRREEKMEVNLHEIHSEMDGRC